MTQEGKSKGWFNGLLLIVNIAFAVLLLFVQLAPYFRPAAFWPLEILAISYPFVLIPNILFIVFWAFKRHRFAFISAAIILIGYDKLSLLYKSELFSVDLIQPEGSLKIMSYNVRLFDLYNWTGNTKTRAKLFQVIKREQPDILCLQEYYHEDEGPFNNNDGVKELLSTQYATIKYGVTMRKTQHWGLATFSKYKIIDEGTVFFEEGRSNFGLYSDILYQEDTIRVYNIHLQSNHLRSEDYKFLEQPDSGSNEQIVNSVKSLTRRVKKAVIKRTEQVDELVAHMESSPYPYMVCGDFNDPPFSYSYNQIASRLTDAFMESGKGMGVTYRGSFPPYRIDFILHQDYFVTRRFLRLNDTHSDHFPIVAWLTKKTD
jgi:endonuclease/exonuclease/phosphatase family metal-dependent hydrolase